MNKKHQIILRQLFQRPVSGNILWREIEALFIALDAEIEEREGSRISVFLFGQIRVFHRLIPHQIPTKVQSRACANGWKQTK